MPAIGGRPATERPRKDRKDDSTAPAKTITSNSDDANKKSHKISPDQNIELQKLGPFITVGGSD
jgi:hypothetical protein